MTLTARRIAEQLWRANPKPPAGMIGPPEAWEPIIAKAITAAKAEAEAERDAARAELANAQFDARLAEGERIAERVFRECELDANVSDGNESADPADHIVPCVNAKVESAKAEGAREALEQAADALDARFKGMRPFLGEVCDWLRARAPEGR